MRGQRIAGAAALIAALTVLARFAGFGRYLVFVWAVGDTDLGDTYVAANLVPNVVFEIVAGGALASLVVPLLAPAIAAGDRAAVSRITAALLSWCLAILVPLAGLVALGSRAIISGLATDPTVAQVEVGARMLQIFAPQLPLYGIAVVLIGVLQAHRRFAWPVLAPLLSSVTVGAAYLTFAAVDTRGARLVDLTTPGLLALAVGTTLGVVMLAGSLVPPVARLGIRPRPTWRFDAEARRRVGGLALAGAVTVASQNLALLVVLWRAWAGPDGANVLFLLAQTIFLVPWAVFAVPVATAAYPSLAQAAATGKHDHYGATLATATRAALLLSLLGAAAMAALAVPVGTLLALLMPTAQDSAGPLAAGIAGFAPALVGYGMFAVLSRALYARGDTAPAAVAAMTGWAAVAAAAVALSAVLAPPDRVLALTLANSVGMTVLGAALLSAVARRAGRAALAGLPRTAAVGAAAAGTAAVAGVAAYRWLLPPTSADPPAVGLVVGSGMLAGGVVAVVFGVVAWMLDRRDMRPLARSVARRLARRDGDEKGTQ